ncbi:MAG: hypothetical protein WBF80_21290, partial [Rhodococcus sp. (in: high G+C Gram-positive bacteria)]
MVTLDEFRSWDSRVLAAASEALMRRWREVAAVHDSAADEVVGKGWDGPAAEAARETLRRIRSDLGDAATELLRIARCTADASIDMESLVAALRSVERTAADERFSIGSDGSVYDAAASYSVALVDLWATMRERRRFRDELAERIAQLIRTATDFDDVLARRLAGGTSAASVATAIAASVPRDGSPAANAAFWSALSPAARTRLLVEQPALIGNLDGLPGRVRD